MVRLREHPVLVLGMAALLSIAGAAGAHAQGVVVIVNASNSVTELSKQQVSDLFLRNVTKWGNDQSVIPVDQARSNQAREAFSRAAHGRSASSVDTYWQTQIFSGKNVPPAIKATDADVLAFVAATRNAIGYVSAGTALNASVKVVRVGGF